MHTITQLTQGSTEWHAHRAKHFNASEASAMLGISQYQTRSDLLKAKSTGITPEVDSAKQRLFDAGHAAEAAARPNAEQIIGEDLYPITATLEVDGLNLSASYDGAVISEEVCWENKHENVNLLDSLSRAIIPEQYHPQLEQQLLVLGAEKVLFTASSVDGTIKGYAWYTSIPEMRQRLIGGWHQFSEDLANYTAPEAAEPKPIGKTPETLPALNIEVTGMVTASNLAAYKEHALTVFAGINRELTTDHHFADAEKTIKWCGDVEDRLQAAKQHALSQTASIDQLFKAIDDISAEARRTRLELDKLVKARKESIRGEIVADGIAQATKHMQSLNDRLGRSLMPPVHADFGGVIKGKRSIDSIREAVSNELARVKIESNAIAERIKAEAAAQARADAEIAAATAKARAEAQADAEDKRASGEAIARAQTVSVRLVESSMFVHEPVGQPAVVTAAIEMRDAQIDRDSVTGPPALKLGQIADRLGFNLTAEFLRHLGFEPAATDKNAKLYHEHSFTFICAAIVDHIQKVQASQAA